MNAQASTEKSPQTFQYNVDEEPEMCLKKTSDWNLEGLQILTTLFCFLVKLYPPMNHWGLCCLDSTSKDSVNTCTHKMSADACIQDKIH